jgi:chromate reductase
MADVVRILGFAGSLRQGSYNRALLRAATQLATPDVTIETFDLSAVPSFNQDFENQPPEVVRDFKAKVQAADALLIVTPEYNYSIPGVLKNAVDWASRPYGDNAFEAKPVALMSASTGMLGGARAQYHLRQTFVTLNMYPLNRPEVFVNFAPQKFDSEGRLQDDKTKELVAGLLKALVAWTQRLKGR